MTKVYRGSARGVLPESCADGRWPALFESAALRGALDALHGGPRWRWAYGAAEGLGWIHIRYPVHPGDHWAPPDEGWHVGADPRSLDARSSVVALPLLTTIRPGGGGTALGDRLLRRDRPLERRARPLARVEHGSLGGSADGVHFGNYTNQRELLLRQEGTCLFQV